MLEPMTDLARSYVHLAHALERHRPGYIDGYFGPEDWQVMKKRPLGELAAEADTLAARVGALEDEPRRLFLSAQLRAMRASLALLGGEPLPYAEEVRRLYDVEAAKVPESVFEEAIARLGDLLPGSGDVAEREQAFRARFAVAPERLPSLVQAVMAELRARTLARFTLPEGEACEVRFVTDKPWSGYNWYLGGYRSRIELNTDLPSYLTDLPDLVAHEAYPGHHTEHAVKEWRLVGSGRLEHSVLLINAPECVVSEGVAMHARQRVMTDAELRDWLENDLAQRAGLAGADVGRMLELSRAKKALRAVGNNAAFLLHEEGASEAEVLGYLRRYGLRKPEEAQKTLEFIQHPLSRSYGFTYTAGAELLDSLFERDDPQAWFARLLAEPVTPGMIRGWLAEA